MTRIHPIILVLAVLAVGLAVAIAACGGSGDSDSGDVRSEETTAPEATATPTSSPQEEKGTIIFSDLNWPSAEIQARAAAYIVEHGYGYPTELVTGDTVSLWAALVNNDTHVTMEIWPAQQEWLEDVDEGTLVALGTSLDTGWEAWVIPQYLKDANPGLVSVTDIPEFAELFVTPDSRGKARFVTCVPGWACEQVNAAKVEAYGLTDVVDVLNPGSGAALFADLEAAYAKGEPWIGYLWHPTPLSVGLDLYILEEPEYSDECWATTKACAYPEARVVIMVNSSLPPRAPEVIEFLEKWDFKAAHQVATEVWMEENNEDSDIGALWYLRNFRDVWASFVPADVAEKVDTALADDG